MDVMSQYCVYLRKSRADREAEAKGESETLARHEKILMELSNKIHITVDSIYREIVSGESIASRPVMQQLLNEVEQSKWTGVLVVEIERLARGDTMDQGLVAQSFKCSNTKIITPLKTYDPLNEYDEEYFEFGLFMSRREYKTINRRLQRGRLQSAKEGKYLGSTSPYGYRRKKLCQDKGYTLEVVQNEALVVQLIYELYCKKRLSFNKIAAELDRLCVIPRKNGSWSGSTIQGILTNPVYIGKIRWRNRPQQKKITGGTVTITRPRTKSDHVLLFGGLHPPIIEESLYTQAKVLLSSKITCPVKSATTLQNPLAGLIRCSKCGQLMVRKPYKNRPDTLLCKTLGCKTVSSPLDIVEHQLLESIKSLILPDDMLQKTMPSTDNTLSRATCKSSLVRLEKDLSNYRLQLDHVHDLLEQGIYSYDTYKKRSQLLTSKITKLHDQLKKLLELQDFYTSNLTENPFLSTFYPRTLGELYEALPHATAKNQLLKRFVSHAFYTKNASNRWHHEKANLCLELVLLDTIREQTN